jgi:hypothetical protein
MVTDKQIEWLTPYIKGEKTRRDDPQKYSVYRKRIRNTIDDRLKNMLWLANNAPEFMRDEEHEIQEEGRILHRRLKILLQIIKAMEPESDPALIRLREEVKDKY